MGASRRFRAIRAVAQEAWQLDVIVAQLISVAGVLADVSSMRLTAFTLPQCNAN
jgi:hypothetical protein